jgi:membrane protein implicated in regulation of membrane protease activity
LRKLKEVHWKKKYFYTLLILAVIGSIFTISGLFINTFYNIFFSICLGLVIGGIFMAVISTFLAEMSTHDLQSADHIDHADLDHVDHADLGHVDHIDHADLGHVDHVDHIDHTDLGHVDHVDHIDHIDLGHVDHVDHIDHTDLGHVDHIDHADLGHVDHVDHIDHIDHDSTPAPFMLLFSTSLLIFGIFGILFLNLFASDVKFLIFFATIAVTYLITKSISSLWKKIAKSSFYKISTTENLIGQKGVIVLDVDKKGGVLKIASNTPMKFEKVHVKPLNMNSTFERGEEVYICDVKDGYLLVDNKASSIRYGRA